MLASMTWSNSKTLPVSPVPATFPLHAHSCTDDIACMNKRHQWSACIQKRSVIGQFYVWQFWSGREHEVGIASRPRGKIARWIVTPKMTKDPPVYWYVQASVKGLTPLCTTIPQLLLFFQCNHGPHSQRKRIREDYHKGQKYLSWSHLWSHQECETQTSWHRGVPA